MFTFWIHYTIRLKETHEDIGYRVSPIEAPNYEHAFFLLRKNLDQVYQNTCYPKINAVLEDHPLERALALARQIIIYHKPSH